MQKKLPKVSGYTIIELFFIVILFLFSFWLMFHTFSYDSSSHHMVLSARIWSDFGAHIPLIRSFSYGENWPPEYPIFPGEKIRYHFLFYAIAGIVERFGVRIDWAVNIPSFIGFFLLLFLLYKVSLQLFSRRSVGMLAVLFFLFNGTLSFIQYFSKFPSVLQAIEAIPSLKDFPSFGPWDQSLVTAFNNLNIYTNQRHLAPSFAIVLGIVYVLLHLHSVYPSIKSQPGKNHWKNILMSIFPTNVTRQPLFGIIIGCLLGILLFLNQAALLPSLILCVGFFLFSPPSRFVVCIAALVSLPFYFFFQQIATLTGSPVFEPGYLSQKPFHITSFFVFWLHNLGFHIILIPLGFLITPKHIRWLFIPLLVIFILPNIFRFSTDMINNHKLFNLFMIFGVMYSAHVLVTFIDIVKKTKFIFLSMLIIPLYLFVLTFSGILDFLVVKNDYPLLLEDIPSNNVAAYIYTTTKPDAVILNSTWFYHPASIAGRKIYNGYSFFTWSAGYDTYGREAITVAIYGSETKSKACSLLKQEKIDFVELNDSPEGFIKKIGKFWQEETPMYINENNSLRLFNVSMMCQQ